MVAAVDGYVVVALLGSLVALWCYFVALVVAVLRLYFKCCFLVPLVYCLYTGLLLIVETLLLGMGIVRAHTAS